MTPLTSPGPLSNYLDWAWAVEIHIRAAKLGHVLDGTDESKPTWSEDNVAVVSLLIQVIDEANYHYIRPLGMNAKGAWLALKSAHEDNTSGGRMYWLQKLIMSQMDTGADVVEHVRKMSQLYHRLNALITTEKPLTTNEIFATCLLISLPADWLPPVSHLFQKTSITSSAVTITLEREAVRRSTKDVAEPVTAAQATKTSRCSFCRRKGHDLTTCRSAAKVLKQSRSDSKSSDNVSSGQSRNQSNTSRYDDHRQSSDKRTKASYVVPLDSSDDDDESPAKASTTRVQVSLSDEDDIAPMALACKSQDWLADTSCSHTMSPNKDDVINAQPRRVNIKLADQSMIKSTQLGRAALPFDVDSPTPALLVPDLEEPLLSISNVCDGGCEVLFTSKHMKVFRSGTFSTSAIPMATDNR